MNISMPESLKSFVDSRVAQASYGSSSEYVRELLRRDQDRQTLRSMLLVGGQSPMESQADSAFFDALCSRI